MSMSLKMEVKADIKNKRESNQLGYQYFDSWEIGNAYGSTCF